MTAQYIYSLNTGAASADTKDLLADIQAEYITALGANLNLSSSTPQGALITAETIARGSVMRNNAEYSNLLNPDLSYGVFLDAICSFLDVPRGINKSTILRGVTIAGNTGTTIFTGSRIRDSNGNTFTLLSQVLIPASKTIQADFKAESFGILLVEPQTFEIVDGVIGWASATSTPTTVVEPGSLALNDPALKNSRRQQLATMGVGASAAVKAALLKVPNLTSCKVVEQNTGVPGDVDGITFALPSGLWVCVAGDPKPEDVAAAMYERHHAGCPWEYGVDQGDPVAAPLGVATMDPSTGVVYRAKYVTAKKYDAYISVTCNQGSSSTNADTAVKAAIEDYAAGNVEGEDGFVVGADIAAFDIAGVISKQIPGLFLKEVMVAVVPAGDPVPVYPDDYAFLFDMPSYGVATTNVGQIRVKVDE